MQTLPCSTIDPGLKNCYWPLPGPRLRKRTQQGAGVCRARVEPSSPETSIFPASQAGRWVFLRPWGQLFDSVWAFRDRPGGLVLVVNIWVSVSCPTWAFPIGVSFLRLKTGLAINSHFSFLCHLLIIWPWAGYLPSQGLHSPILEMGINSVYLPGLLLWGSNGCYLSLERYRLKFWGLWRRMILNNPNTQDYVSVARVLIYLCTNGCVSKYWAPFSLNQLNSDSQFPPEDFLLQSFWGPAQNRLYFSDWFSCQQEYLQQYFLSCKGF